MNSGSTFAKRLCLPQKPPCPLLKIRKLSLREPSDSFASLISGIIPPDRQKRVPGVGQRPAFSGADSKCKAVFTAHLNRLLASLSRPGAIMGPGVNSPHPSTGPIESLPAITRPEAAVRALIEFFEIHQILMCDDFVKLLKKTEQ
jgi:hypothetical protein